ncbi:MAG: hypothetical protein JXK93_10060, partial [Sphaerochaetaceae bacterium]|nr:hypothetical protein [Sphaerochaetaceae bacterium]
GNMSEFSDDLKGYFGKPIGKGLVVLFGIGVLYLVLAMIFSFWPFSLMAGVIKKATSPDNIIQSYEYFYDSYHSILAMQENVNVMKEYLVSSDATEPLKSQRSIELSGLMMNLNRCIEEYNAESRKINHNMWKADDLPYRISLEDLQGR